MNTYKITARVLSCLIAFSVPVIQAQNDETVFELSPFSVDVSGDVGYAAQNTLAGSRMNSRLKDTPAPISVYTKEFLADIGADSVEDAMEYSINQTAELSQGGGSFGANQLTAFDARYRIRGLLADQSRNFFAVNFDQDVFNIERIDESRGPNSILFGVGKAGGVINSSTKRARLNEDLLEVSATIGDADRSRVTVDYNKALIEGKLGVRLNALYGDYGDNERPWVYHRDTRAHLAVAWKPTESTTINAEYEWGDVVDAPTYPYGPSDGFRTWVQNGRQAVEDGATAAEGVSGALNPNNPRIFFIDNSGTSVDLAGQALTRSVSGHADNHFAHDNNVISDPAISGDLVVPVQASISGMLSMRGTRDVDNMSVSLEQKLGENTFVELAWANYDYDRFSFRGGHTGNVFGDPNRTLPDGSSNPYFGELYLDNSLNRDFRFYGEEYLRATVSHEVKTDGWLGTHRLAAMYQERESVFLRNMQANVWQGAPTEFGVPYNTNPWHNNNRVWYRHYITNPESKADWRRAQDLDLTGIGMTYSLPAGSTLYDGTVTPGATALTSDWRQWVAQDTQTEIDALMFAGQSYLLDNKLVVTYGYREDDLSSNAWRQSNALRDPATNERNIIDYTNPRVTPPIHGRNDDSGSRLPYK